MAIAKANMAVDDELYRDVRKRQDSEFQRRRTFFYGLKFWSPNNTQMTHLTLYLLRRLGLAFSLVFLDNHIYIGVSFLMLSSLFIMLLLWRES